MSRKKTSGKPPAFQFYGKDWLARTRELGPYGRGVHIDMMVLCWETGSVPDDPVEVANAVGGDPVQVAAIWTKLRPKYTNSAASVATAVADRLLSGSDLVGTEEATARAEIVDREMNRLGDAGPGRLFNVRIEEERASQASYRALQSQKGRASAEAKKDRKAAEMAAPRKKRSATAPLESLPFNITSAMDAVVEGSGGIFIVARTGVPAEYSPSLGKLIRAFPDLANWRALGSYLSDPRARGRYHDPGPELLASRLGGKLLEAAVKWDADGRPPPGTAQPKTNGAAGAISDFSGAPPVSRRAPRSE
jgi:hypothetical protein